jgi:uncharacterized protein (TIGR03382 family)
MTRTALVIALFGTAALAQDTWTEPFPGVRHLHRVVPGQNIHVAVIDLCHAGVSVRVTGSSERGQRPSSFGASVGAQVAINGDFFSYGSYQPDGIAVHAWKQWPGTADHTYVGQLWFGDERAGLIHHQDVITPAPFMQEVISGHPTLVWNGVVEDNSGDTGLCTARHPRTAVGLSRDRRTLYLAVVDGRAAPSRLGMTCAELSTLMKDLGAWTAMALDGGGSSAMWLAGRGVVNHPSDGSERVVANHLAVYATGQGDAAHCERNTEEVLYQLPVHSVQGSSDLDGDGTADACLRGKDGVTCATSSGASFSTPFAGPALTDAAQWWWPTYGMSLRTGDFTGDGKDAVCARFEDGVHCWPSTGDGFGAEVRGPALLAADGWNELDRFTTAALVDVTGDRKADYCVRASDRLLCFPSTGDGFGAPFSGPALSAADGWDDPSRYGTLRYGDVNGDGLVDVCAREDVYFACWLSDGHGFSRRIVGPAWPTFFGFGDAKYWSTIRLVDVNGDGRADACVRTAGDFRCHLSTGEGFGEAVIGPPLVDFFFSRHRYYSTIRLADVDGDGDRDLCVRTGDGLRCWRWTGETFGGEALVGPALSDANGWGAFEYFSTIRFADVDADGRDDVCARSAAGLHCWLSDGNGFPTRVDGPAWSDAAGFGLFLYPPSLRLAGGGPRCRPVAEVCGNAQDDDCDGEVDEGCAVPPPVPPPTPPVSPPTTPAPEAPPPGGTVFGGCQATGAGPPLGLALLALAARRRRG